MKIALITNSYKSPTELWVWRQASFMKKDIGYIGILDKLNEQDEDGIPVVGLVERNANTGFHPFFLLRKLVELEEKYGIDTYYIHYLTNAFALKDFIALTDKKVFVHCHGFDITFDLKLHQNPAIDHHPPKYLTFSLPRTVVYITDSVHARSLLISSGVSEAQVRVLYFGVPVEGIHLQKRTDIIKILYLGRLVDFKGPDLTIRAFELACEMGMNAELVMVGDGPLMVTCQLLKLRSRFSERIQLLGTLPYESARKLREECHIFTAHNMKGSITNQQEAFGVSIIEAMGAGLPVVTGENGGVKETVIPGETGFLFEPGDLKKHAEYLVELARNHELRLVMAQKAYERVSSNFTLEKEKQSLIKIMGGYEGNGSVRKNAVVIGPYRYHNFGDDLIGAIIAKHLQSREYNVSIPLLGNENVAWLKINYSHKDAMRDANLIVIGGGGLLGDAGISPDDYYRELAVKVAIEGSSAGKRVITTGIGAGPLELERSKELSLQIIALSEKVGIRDSESRIFLEQLGVDKDKLVEGADVALLCSRYLNFDRKMSDKIGLQFDISNFKDVISANPHISDIYNAVIKYAGDNRLKTILISNGNFKSQLCGGLAENCETLCYADLRSFLPRLAGLRAIFTSHLHLAITAYSMKIPCFSLYVREKTRRFYDQIGYPERAIDLTNATVDDFERIIREVEKASWNSKDDENLHRLQMEAMKLLELI